MSFKMREKQKERGDDDSGGSGRDSFWQGSPPPPHLLSRALIEKIHGQPGVEARLSWAFSIKRVGGTIGSVVRARKVMRLQMESCGGKQKMRRSFSATGLSGRCPSRTR